MISLQDFKTRVLAPLLRGDLPSEAAETPITLFSARLDRPEAYLFESDRWDEIFGASRRLRRAIDKMGTVLAADGYGARDVLYLNGSIFALVHDHLLAERWSNALQRVIAAETDVVTISSISYPLKVRHLTGGLYAAPTAVIGVPGVNDYQERVNRYYGLASPSTIPKEEAIAARRHFGEVAALAHSLLDRAQESRQIIPFYDGIAFTERCESCKARPAERLDSDERPVCGVCVRKRREESPDCPSAIGLIWIEAAGLKRVLENQRHPDDYRRITHEVDETLQLALPGDAISLISGEGRMLIVAAADDAPGIATTMLHDILFHYESRPPAPFIAAVALDEGCRFQALYGFVCQIARHMSRYIEGATGLIDVRTLELSQPFDRLRKPLTFDEARKQYR